MTSLAIVNKGVLFQPTVSTLRKAGYSVKNSRELIQECDGLRLVLARAQDIPLFVYRKTVDIGITGSDLVLESGLKLRKLADLPYGECKLVLAAPKGTQIKNGIRVATCFPNLASKYFAQKRIPAEIIQMCGAAELAPKAGLADAIVDLTSTGRTLRENNLEIIDTILESSACIISSRRKLQGDAKKIIDKIGGKNDRNL